MERNPQAVTVAQAAEMLGIGKNAVRARLKKGTLSGKKVTVEGHEEWRVELAGVLESQGLPHAVAQFLCEFLGSIVAENIRQGVQETGRQLLEEGLRSINARLDGLAVAFDLREQLGRERAGREAAERKAEKLGHDVEALVKELGRASARAGAMSPDVPAPEDAGRA